MSNPTSFINNYTNTITNFITLIENLRTMNDQLTQDTTIPTRYFETSGSRTDIEATDVTNAQAAITQMLFTFDSGTPTQKSYLFNMLA